jgi:hypothetical protein
MILAALLFAATTATTPPATWKSTLIEYRTELAKHDVEKTFLAAADLERLLLPTLDQLSAGDFAQLEESTAGGMQLSRKGMIFAHPDAEFFLKMAQEFGTQADVTFFQEFQRSFPNGPLPSWILLTPTGACVDAKGAEFPARLRGWQVYAARFPNSYRAYVQMLLRGMEADGKDVTRQCK